MVFKALFQIIIKRKVLITILLHFNFFQLIGSSAVPYSNQEKMIASFDVEKVQSIKKACRRKIISMAKNEDHSQRGRTQKGTHKSFDINFSAPIDQRNDDAKKLVDDPQSLSENIFDLSELTSATLENKPWSDSYWPLYLGGLSARYDQYFSSWQEAKSDFDKRSSQSLIEQGLWDYLSPAEKYDALLSNLNYSKNLSKSMWQTTSRYQDEDGDVERWMGFCHGWAAASMMTPEPKKKVYFKYQGKDVAFFPSDIKGLATVLWANSRFDTKYIGGRCNEEDPKERVEECLDNNPGTWHMVILHQIAKRKRSFIMDAVFDREVWNHPVSGYHLIYKNLKTHKSSRSIKDTMILYSDYREQDAKREYRSAKIHFILGVKMKVEYIVENSASLDEYQDVEISHMELEYDLELDKNGKIIGGEWIGHRHPDFLWLPAQNATPMSYSSGERLIELETVPERIGLIARYYAEQGNPYLEIIDFLIEQSSQEN